MKCEDCGKECGERYMVASHKQNCRGNDPEPRAWTGDEMAEKFVEYLMVIGKYWANVEGQTTEEKMEGFAHSLIVNLEGCGGSLPGFKLVPHPHPSDKEFHIDEGENYWDDTVDLVAFDLRNHWREKVS